MENNTMDISWYLKYRPKTMEEYSGPIIQDIIKRRFAKRENMPNVILIKGSRGCGKTTFARIITKYYLCLHPNEDGTPCEECEMCQSINDILIGGESLTVECPGVQEIDATNVNGKADIQDVLEEALIPPMYTNYKIVILDECHLITQQAQSSLLKILENIKSYPYLIVIFATTNPEKLLDTIKSRCTLQLDAVKQSVRDMANRLMFIAKKEKLTTSQEALEVIARKGNRIPRECINLLENVAKTYDRMVTLDNIKKYTNSISSEYYLEYFKAANESLADILAFIKKLKENDTKLMDFANGLVEFAMSSIYIKHGIYLEDYPVEYIKKIKELFEIYSSSDFDLLLQLLEYLSNAITSDNDAKNELLLTTTALRISKIDLLAKGLSEEHEESITENKISLYEHSKKLKPDNIKALERAKIELDLHTVNDEFDGVRQVSSQNNLLKQVTIPPVIKLSVEEEQKEEKVSNTDKVDDFFN